MSNPDSISLAARAALAGFHFVLVGGNAINLHAYNRSTFDVDLLIEESDADRWIAFFNEHGYTIFHRTANFVRLHFAADPTGALPVDLMLADAHTFSAIQQDSRPCDIGNGLSLPIPSPLHLIAMKLHAARTVSNVALTYRT